MHVQFAVLASGSRGNSVLVRGGGGSLLIDAGLGPRATARRLAEVGASWDSVAAVVLTHTHGDHINDAALRYMARMGIPLHCHERHRADLATHPGYSGLEGRGLVQAYDDRPFLARNGMSIEPLPLWHDADPTFGFRIEARPAGRSRPVSLGYLADTGTWSESLADAVTDVDLLGVEFNHDVQMQLRSGRSPHLIRRVLGDRGHLSNAQGADLLSAVLGRSRRGTVRDVVLLHLSQQCNLPELALVSARSVGRGRGRRMTVHAAHQASPHPNLFVRPAPPQHRVARQAQSTLFPWESA